MTIEGCVLLGLFGIGLICIGALGEWTRVPTETTWTWIPASAITPGNPTLMGTTQKGPLRSKTQ